MEMLELSQAFNLILEKVRSTNVTQKREIEEKDYPIRSKFNKKEFI